MEVRVKHLVQYLQSLDQEATVELDKDGWMEDYLDEILKEKSPVALIKARGVFSYHDFSKFGGGMTLIINN